MKSATSSVIVSTPNRYDYLDLTDDLRRAIKDAGVTDGAVVAFCAHTTCALLINEWEDGALQDFRRQVTRISPPGGVNRTALSTRLNSTWWIRSTSASAAR